MQMTSVARDAIVRSVFPLEQFASPHRKNSSSRFASSTYTPTGIVTVDGQQVTAGNLQSLLSQLQAQGWKVGDVEIQ